MAVTRSIAARARLFDLLSLPDDLLLTVARHALAMEVPAALRLLQTCKALQARLGAIGAEAEALKLCWVEEGMVEHTISEDGLTLTEEDGGTYAQRLPWASGPLLPTVGRSTWAVRVEKSRYGDGFGVNIGVCDAAQRNRWALYLIHGKLWRNQRDERGRRMWIIDEETGEEKLAPPPDGFPDGDYKQVLLSEEGKPDHLYGRANGAIIEVCLDHAKGALSFGINGGPLQRALGGFPVGAAMRPFAWLPCKNDAVRFARPYIQHKYK